MASLATTTFSIRIGNYSEIKADDNTGDTTPSTIIMKIIIKIIIIIIITIIIIMIMIIIVKYYYRPLPLVL